MLNHKDFRKHAHELVDWMADYLQDVENLPVKSMVKPGEIYQQIPAKAPGTGESMQQIMRDFQQIILPGITHWQSPNFFAYFPANSSYASLLGEMLTATLGAQCMIWDTSPAAAELEERMIEWLRNLLGLPEQFTGAIQDTASTATLTAILTAREQATHYSSNLTGLQNTKTFRIYCSEEAHSSVEKAVAIAGIGRENMVKVAVDDAFRMNPEALSVNIAKDREHGFTPLCVVATLGTTGVTAIDPLAAIGEVCKQQNIWLHVDAAFAGTALVLPEFRWMIAGIENVDSFVMNPHKWMFTNFDCSAYFVRDKEALLRTFAILPEYLKTESRGSVNDYRDWGIQLGRRFRALKLWFVLRNFGIDGIRERLRNHIALADEFARRIEQQPDFEMMAPRHLSLVCFRYHPEHITNEDEINKLNTNLLKKLNATGRVYLTHTKVGGKYTLRVVVGQTYVKKQHVDAAWDLILQTCLAVTV